jgi:hypothetical protein
LTHKDDFKALASWLFEVLNNETTTLSSLHWQNASTPTGIARQQRPARRKRAVAHPISLLFQLSA